MLAVEARGSGDPAVVAVRQAVKKAAHFQCPDRVIDVLTETQCKNGASETADFCSGAAIAALAVEARGSGDPAVEVDTIAEEAVHSDDPITEAGRLTEKLTELVDSGRDPERAKLIATQIGNLLCLAFQQQ